MSRAPSLIEEQDSLLTAQTELTQRLLRFVEEQLARAERAEAENERLAAALEVERHFWEAMQRLGRTHPMYLTREQVDRRLEALEAALEGSRHDGCPCQEYHEGAVPTDLFSEQEQLLTAQTELTQHLLRFVEEQLARAERAEEQCQQLMARLEALRAQNVLQEQEVDEAEQKLADASLAQTRLEARCRALEKFHTAFGKWVRFDVYTFTKSGKFSHDDEKQGKLWDALTIAFREALAP